MLSTDEIRTLVMASLEDLKAQNIVQIDVRGRCGFADWIVVASGNSDRHVKSIADNVVTEAKKAKCAPIGVEGERASDWVLVDLADVVVHVMLPDVRDFYNLERLWQVDEDLNASKF